MELWGEGGILICSLFVSVMGSLVGVGSYLKTRFYFSGVSVEFCVLKFRSCRSNWF